MIDLEHLWPDPDRRDDALARAAYDRRALRAKNTTHACCEALRQGLIR